ncbi:MAG: dihydrofolate reductase family protein [Acidimicrobiales bacterium]
MRIVISEFMSLDGVIQAPGGPDEDRDGGFAHGGWSMAYFEPEVMGPVLGEVMAATQALLFGRRTWRVMADAWPGRAGDPFADQMNAIDKYVVSGTLTEADIDWGGTQLIEADGALEAIAALRDQDGGDLQVMGSVTLARALIGAGMVDEYRLMIEPIVLGGGKRLFPDDGAAKPLELISTLTTSTGVHVCTYRPAASPLVTGSSDELYV